MFSITWIFGQWIGTEGSDEIVDQRDRLWNGACIVRIKYLGFLEGEKRAHTRRHLF
jgi:hypothetical protein